MSQAQLGEWTRLPDAERAELLTDLARHLEAPLEPDVEAFRQRLRCYPDHHLIRIRYGGRESYLLHKPNDPNPLDWTSTPIHELNPRALRIRDAEDAEAYLRFFVWAIAASDGRFFITERIEDLPLRAGAPLEGEVRSRIEAALGPLRLLGEEPGQYRFEAPVLYGTGLFKAEFLVTGDGSVTMVDDTPIEARLPVEEDQLGSDRYFILVMKGGGGEGEGVPADERSPIENVEFLQRLKQGEPVEDVRVQGLVDARGVVFDRPIVVRNVLFNGSVVFEGARFTCPVRFENCTIRECLDLNEARLEASFMCPGLEIGRNKPMEGGAGLRARAIRVAGTLDFTGLRLRGGLDMRNADVEGDIRFDACEIAGWEPISPEADPDTLPDVLDLQGARIRGDLDFFAYSPAYALRAAPADVLHDAEIPGFSIPMTIVRGSINGMRIEVGGVLSLNGLRVHGGAQFALAKFEGGVNGDLVSTGSRLIVRGTLAFPSAHSRGGVSLNGVHVGGDLLLFGARIAGSVYLRTSPAAGRRQHAVILGDFNISGIQAEDVELEGADLGTVKVITGDIGRLRLLPGLEAVRKETGARAEEDERVRWRLRPCRMGALIIQTAKFRHGISLTGVHVEIREDRSSAGWAGMAELNLVECGGAIEFWTERVYLQMSEPPPAEEWDGGARPEVHTIRTEFPNGLVLRGVRAAAGLSLVNVRAEGMVQVNDCHIGQDLDLGSHGPADAHTITTCRGLEVKGTVCEGDADFTGLRSEGRDGEPAHVLANRLRVSGELLFARPLRGDDFDSMSDKPEDRIEAYVSGRLDLSAAEASHLVISGKSFQKSGVASGISFERGTFRRFQVVSPLPAEHDMSNVTVERWQIHDKHLLEILGTSTPFRRSTYLGVERVLRNEGNDGMADEVFRAMHRRAIRVRADDTAGREAPAGPKPGFWQRFDLARRREGSRFLGWSIGWGTQNSRPLWVLSIPLFLISLWIFSAPANVTPTTALMEVTPHLAESAHPTDLGMHWGWGDAAWMALRYQVPVIPIFARARWEPGRDGTQLVLPGTDWTATVPWMSPEDYALLVFLLHAVIWPLFLLGVTSKVIRNRQ